MTYLDKLEARLANTEKALFALATVMQDTQAAHVQEGMSHVMQDYFDANVLLGFDPRPDFIKGWRTADAVLSSQNELE